MEESLERKIAQLEISFKDIDNRLTALHREQATLIMELKSVKQKETKDHSAEIREVKKSLDDVNSSLEKKITEFKKHANSILDEIYDSVDELKKTKPVENKQEQSKPVDLRLIEEKIGAITEALKILNGKIEASDSKHAGVRKEIESIKPANAPTLVKDLSLEVQKLNNKFFVLEDSVKAVQKRVEADN